MNGHSRPSKGQDNNATGDGRTAIPDNTAYTGSLEDGVERWNRRIQALRRKVDGAVDGTALGNIDQHNRIILRLARHFIVGTVSAKIPRNRFFAGRRARDQTRALLCAA